MYEIRFLPSAYEEWKKLPKHVRERFQKVLKRRQAEPRVPKDGLRGYPDLFKIKSTSPQFRLVYRVNDEDIVIEVICTAP